MEGAPTRPRRRQTSITLQRALRIPADGVFGPGTAPAVRRFQKRHGLTADGIVGPATWAALGHAGLARTLRQTLFPNAGSVVARVVAAANRIADQALSLRRRPPPLPRLGYDCSGSVSYALHGGGLLSSRRCLPAPSSAGARRGPGATSPSTPTAATCTWSSTARRFDTSGATQRGTRWTSGAPRPVALRGPAPAGALAVRVAVVGGGTAGLATAALLHDDGHEVEVFERFTEPAPVGAGLLLQPTGLAVLGALGLRDRVVASGARVERLWGETAAGRPVLDLAYADWRTGAHGLGVHRHILFDALWGAVAARSIPVHAGAAVTEPPAGYDLVVGTDGARSALRGDGRAFGRRRMRPYPWGALWAIVDDPDGRFGGVLHQTYRGTHEMVGTLPSGRPDDGPARVSVFISVAVAAREQVRLETLKAEVRALCGPRIDPVLEQLEDEAQLLWAGYHDVVLGRLHHGRVVLAGDAAHAMSPQLGQGANLALVDAWVLADCLRTHSDVDAALAAYSRRRRAHLRFYAWASRLLTPVFQSRLEVLAPPRDLLAAPLGRVPFVRDQMLAALAGRAVPARG